MATSAFTTISSGPQDKLLPQIAHYSIEYPGYVQHSSLKSAVQNVGGQDKVDQVFRRHTQKSDSLLELSFCPGTAFAHPVPGEVVGSNKLLLKVVKKKRRMNDTTPRHGGEYVAQVVGIVSKTVRFRSMADFQFYPNEHDPVSQLRVAMKNMDVDALCSYRVPSRHFDHPPTPAAATTDVGMDIDPELLGGSAQTPNSVHLVGLRLFPPPVFSRQTIPQGYNFKANPASMITTAIDEQTGEERKRMINRMRWKGYGPASIMFADTHVPSKPPAAVENERKQVNRAILEKLEKFFESRPVWTRMSLFNQLAPLECREILNSKLLLPLCCYVFQDGPWRDTLVRFSYDPRKDPSAGLYQRIYFRNANHPISRPSVTTRRQERNSLTESRGHDQDGDIRTSHIFDGQTLSKETAAFQLCDITDPMLKGMIENPDALRETCNEKDGWYTTHALEEVKSVLRYKFFSLLEGHPVSDDDCRALLSANEGSTKAITTHRASKLRAGKHNMAKGALRPEDAAALRLRATLDRNIKSFHAQRSL